MWPPVGALTLRSKYPNHLAELQDATRWKIPVSAGAYVETTIYPFRISGTEDGAESGWG